MRAEPALREASHANPSAEQKRHIGEALTALASPQALGRETLREVRAVLVLERVGTPSARSLLTELANGVPEASLTHAAKAALQRLRR